MKKLLGILVLGLLFCNVSFASDDDIVQQLKDLKELYDSGTLTKEEFQKVKKKILWEEDKEDELVKQPVTKPAQSDIGDFEIEGISIYDSALDHFSENQIKINIQDWYKNKEFSTSSLRHLPKFKVYEEIQISFKTDDKKYIIHNIDGIIHQNIDDCYKELDKTDKELSAMFKNAYKRNKKTSSHSYDKTGESKFKDIYWKFNSGELILVSCTDWSKNMEKEKKYEDNWRVTISSEEFDNFMIDPY